MFLKIIGLFISIIFLYVGFRFTFYPLKSINWIQRIKYKTTAEPAKREKTVSLIFGILMILIGIYYLTFVILSFVYPA